MDDSCGCEIMRYMVILEQGENGVGAVGETKEEVLRLIGEAVELHLEGLREEGLPITEPSSSSEYVEVGSA